MSPNKGLGDSLQPLTKPEGPLGGGGPPGVERGGPSCLPQVYISSSRACRHITRQKETLYSLKGDSMGPPIC